MIHRPSLVADTNQINCGDSVEMEARGCGESSPVKSPSLYIVMRRRYYHLLLYYYDVSPCLLHTTVKIKAAHHRWTRSLVGWTASWLPAQAGSATYDSFCLAGWLLRATTPPAAAVPHLLSECVCAGRRWSQLGRAARPPPPFTTTSEAHYHRRPGANKKYPSGHQKRRPVCAAPPPLTESRAEAASRRRRPPLMRRTPQRGRCCQRGR